MTTADRQIMRNCGCCSIEPNLPFRCQYCDGVYCKKHRLPEKHDCDGVEFLSDPGKRFESKFTDEVVRDEDGFKSPEPLDPDEIDTVGTSQEPDWSDGKSPPVRLRDETEEGGEEASRMDRLGVWLRRLLR